MENHPLVCYGDHHSLANALSSRDIESFRHALHSPTEIEKYETDTSMTIFEKACQTPDSAQFIEECILAGCDVNKLNPELNKRPIHFVVDSQCEGNLAALLGDPSVDVNARGLMFKTPINVLSEKITNDNFRKVFSCFKLLIQYGADVNLPDKRELTPITNILRNRHLNSENKKTLVNYLLQNVVEVDIDTYRNGEGRQLLKEFMPNIDIAPKQLTSNDNDNDNDNIVITPRHLQWDFNRLYLALKNEREIEFLLGLSQIAEKNPETLPQLFTAAEHRETLLITAISKDLPNAIQKMVDFGANVNYCVSMTKDVLPPVKQAVICGHWKCLEILLKVPELEINSAPVLPTVVRDLSHKSTKFGVDHRKCFEMLLNHRNLDINQLDQFNCTALYYAVKFNETDAILELLKRGAYIGVKSRFNRLAISDINPKVLEKHFDSCITTNGFRTSDDNFEISFDYKNFIPHNGHDDSLTNEMVPIEYISKSKDLKQLIMHPLIGSFLSLKWNRLAFFFYINFLLCSLYALITVSYILFYYNQNTSDSDSMAYVMKTAIFLLTIYIAIREMSQFVFSPRIYLMSLENYLECTLIVLVMLILFDVCDDNLQRIFASSTILLIAIEIFLLAGSLPFWSFSCHYVMLKTVTWSFLKSLSLYAIILIAFSLSFFTLLHEPTKANQPNTVDKEKQSNEDEDDDEFNKFSNVGLSIMKTVVMSTGEFDVASINFKLNAFSYIVFIIYLFIVSIVLLNLLNGLAVSDTQAIKSEAELTNFIRRSQVLARYDGVLASNCPTLFSLFALCSRSDASADVKSIQHIRVKPNDNNQILIPDLNTSEGESDFGDNLRPLRCINVFSCSDACARMDSKIVKLALQVLDKNGIQEHDNNERDALNKRIIKIEDTLKIIINKLDDLSKK